MQDHDIRNLRYVYECLGFKKKKKTRFVSISLSLSFQPLGKKERNYDYKIKNDNSIRLINIIITSKNCEVRKNRPGDCEREKQKKDKRNVQTN